MQQTQPVLAPAVPPDTARSSSLAIWGAAPRLGDFLHGRDNNLNLLRVIAAAGVLVSHAYPLTRGPKAVQPLAAPLGMALGGVAVAVFFVVSGLLVSQSWERSRGLLRFSLARGLRIFPGLAVVLFLTAAVLGPLVTSLPLAEYATRFETWRYTPRNLLLVSMEYPLPGVFEHNPFGPDINGSLWTLAHEVACYVGIAVLGVAGAFRTRRVFAAGAIGWILFACAIRATGWLPHESRVTNFLELSPYFAAGVGAYLLRDRIRLHGVLLAVTLGIIVATRYTPVFPFLFPFALGYVVLWFAFVPGGWLRRYNRAGDYSYGIYIYAFPMQQLAAWLVPGISPLGDMAFALPATLVLAIASWHGIEKRSLAWRDRAALLFVRRRAAA
jgi:peptidoglycan/LPS O-acetylase OafA/YrhL